MKISTIAYVGSNMFSLHSAYFLTGLFWKFGKRCGSVSKNYSKTRPYRLGEGDRAGCKRQQTAFFLRQSVHEQSFLNLITVKIINELCEQFSLGNKNRN